MGFEGLLGNEQLKKNLRASVSRGRAAHFYLLSGPAGSGKRTLARLLAAALICKEADKPCLQCNACRKVLAGSHPDVITVTDPDRKEVRVDVIRQYRDDLFVRPNEADRKVYVFPQAIRVEGQHALLKVLEEPPAYGVFLVLSENPEALLPTLRSRCTQLSLTSLPEALLRKQLQELFPQAREEELNAAISRSGGYLGQARALLQADAVSPQTQGFADSFGRREPQLLLQTLAPMEKWKRDPLIQELQEWIRLLHEALLHRSGSKTVNATAAQLSKSRSSTELLWAIEQLKKAIEYAMGNVSVAAVCGQLVWALR